MPVCAYACVCQACESGRQSVSRSRSRAAPSLSPRHSMFQIRVSPAVTSVGADCSSGTLSRRFVRRVAGCTSYLGKALLLLQIDKKRKAILPIQNNYTLLLLMYCIPETINRKIISFINLTKSIKE